MQEMPLSFFYLLFIFSGDEQMLRGSTDTISLPFKKRKLYHAIQPECTKNNAKICPYNQEKSLENKSEISPSPKSSKDDDHTSNNFRYKLLKRMIIIRSGRLPSEIKFINRQKSINEKTDKVPDFENTSLSHKRDIFSKEKHNSLENNSQESDNSSFKGFQDKEIKEKRDHNLHLNQGHISHKRKNSEILFKCLSSQNLNSKSCDRPCCSRPNTFNKHKELFSTEASSGNLNIRNSKIFSLLGDKRDEILNLNLIFKRNFYQIKIEKTKTELFERPFKLPCQINYKKIINRIEKEYLISLQSLANCCKGGNKRHLNSVLFQDYRNKLCDIFFNDLIIEKINFLSKENNLIEGKECFEPMPEKYFFEFCEYKKDFRDKINIVLHHNTSYFAEYTISCILKNNSLDHISNNVSIIQHSRCSESTNQKAIAIFKLIQKAICNVDFHIICLLIPEFEEIIYLFIKNRITLQNIKFTLFIIGVTIYKLNFLKSNIKNEIKSNEKEHSNIYIESPLLKTFITSVQTILILTIERKLELYQNIRTYKILLFKNFLNFISTTNIFKKKSDFYFFINFINEKYFTAYFDKCDRFEDIFKIFLKEKMNLTDFGDIKNENDVVEKAKEFLDAIYHNQIGCINDEVKSSILKIRNFFEE